VRAYGEMVDVLWQRGERDAAIRLEEFWNDLARLQTFSLLCAYCIDHLDPQAYADRFGAQIERIGDDTHGLHPCSRWRMTLPSGDTVTIWAARDLESLVVKIEHVEKDENDESQPFTTTELLDVRVGADPDLFEKPKGFTEVKSYGDLLK